MTVYDSTSSPFHSCNFPQKLKTLLTAKLSAASLKKRAGRPETDRERRARAYLALKNVLWVSSRSLARSINRYHRSIEQFILVRRKARTRRRRGRLVRAKRANVLLARSAQDRSSGTLPLRYQKSRRSRRSGTGDVPGGVIEHSKHNLLTFSSASDHRSAIRRPSRSFRGEERRLSQTWTSRNIIITQNTYLSAAFTPPYLKRYHFM